MRSRRVQSLDFILEPLIRDTVHPKMCLKGYSGISGIEKRKFGRESLTTIKGLRDSEWMGGKRQEK